MKLQHALLTLLFGLSIIGCQHSEPEAQSVHESTPTEIDYWIQELNKQIDQFEGGDSIEIDGLPLSELPDEFYDNTHIRFLWISCIEPGCLVKLSSKIAQLTKLETLILSKTSLSKLPKEIGQLSTLKELRILAGGDLTELPEEVGNLKQLEILDLWRNKLVDLPESLYQLKNLKTLYIGDNNFSTTQIREIKRRLPAVDVKTYR
ncbi:MAG: leucine-rich repeat domain-containing protein [Bacteroidota bacterium]